MGIFLDTEKIEARLPQDKLEKAIAWVEKIWDAQSIARSELESVVGFLSFAAKVIVPGRAFLQGLFDALAKRQSYYHLDVEMRADLNWWKEFLPQWNDIQLLKRVADRPVYSFYTNASGKWGMEGYILGNGQTIPGSKQAFSQRFSTREKSKHIGPKEMSAVLLALNKWNTQLAGSKLLIFGDNFGVVQGLTHLLIRGAAMSPLKKIAMMLALYNIVIESQWTSTKDNWLADILSRGEWWKLADSHSHLKQVFETQTPYILSDEQQQ